jgi:transcriptional regulator with XRE-family HTH domain
VDFVHEQFAANLRRRREQAGLSQEALAHMSNLDPTTISLLELHKRSPTLKTIVCLATGLGLSSPAELLDDIRL